jgi:uracil-DNA glycosylase
MNPIGDAAFLLHRYLRQVREIGEHELILDRPSVELLGPLIRTRKDRVPSKGPTATGRPTRAERPSRPRLPTSAPVPIVSGALAPLSVEALACTRCGLAGTRTTVVFGEGDPGARLLVVGEAPGAEEDRTGRPFVGRAGQLLDRLLLSAGFERPSVYICNVLKCRPPGNRNPEADEMAACRPFLQRQIEIVGPAAILACGTFAAQTLLASEAPISRLRGAVHDFEGVPVVPMYHPAALLRNRAWVRLAWEDLQRVRSLIPA